MSLEQESVESLASQIRGRVPACEIPAAQSQDFGGNRFGY